jgi:hypothetical protein
VETVAQALAKRPATAEATMKPVFLFDMVKPSWGLVAADESSARPLLRGKPRSGFTHAVSAGSFATSTGGAPMAW